MPRIQPDNSVPLPPDIENASFATMGMLFRTMARRPQLCKVLCSCLRPLCAPELLSLN